jgi:hypothetical protein
MNLVRRVVNGYPTMSLKKGLPLLFVCALLLVGVAAAGCTSTTKEAGNSSGNAASGVSDTGGLQMAITGRGEMQQIGTYQPIDGYKFVWYNVTLTDLTYKDYMIAPSNFGLRTSDGQTWGNSPATSSSSINGLKDVHAHLNPGETVAGTVPFAIPQGASPTQLSYSDVLNNVTLKV